MKVAPLMRQVRYDRFGGVDQLWIDEVSKPEDSPGQAVVRVCAYTTLLAERRPFGRVVLHPQE